MDKSNLYILKYVKAGKAGKVLSLSREMILEFQDQDCFAAMKEYFKKENNGKDAFVVVGESMAREGIFTGDLLFVSTCNIDNLQCGNFLILKVDRNRVERFFKTNQDLGYKMRKFLLVADMTKSFNELFEQVKENDDASRYSDMAEATFMKKLKQAKEDLSEEKRTLLSVTYTEKGMDYSFHAFADLYAKVDYVYRKECGQYKSVKSKNELWSS